MAVRRSPGALEAAVMRVLWSHERPLGAGEIRELLGAEADPPAFTTVVTVLGRLLAKGRVVRSVSADDGHYVWAAATSESAHAVEGMLSALLAASDRSAALLQFAGSLDAQDLAMLRTALGSSGPGGDPDPGADADTPGRPG